MEVLVTSTASTLAPDYITKITRITDGRGGTIYVGEAPREKVFDIRGHQRGETGFSGSYIRIATLEDSKKLALDIRKRKLESFNFHGLTPEQCSEIVLFMRSKSIKI